MDEVARWQASDRAALFEKAAEWSPFPNVALVEKDFWVCWCLHRLQGLPNGPRLLFKGGTSLSKGLGLIHRFSEDVDLGISRRDLGVAKQDDPMRTRTRSAHQKAVRRLRRTLAAFVRDELFPSIRLDFAEALQAAPRLAHDTVGPEHVVRFDYPREDAVEDRALAGALSPQVRIEFGARSDHHPVLEVEVRPVAAEVVPAAFSTPSCRVVALAPERTLLEKALLLHAGVCRHRLAAQAVRHAYDLACLSRAGVAGVVTRSLLEEVIRHTFVFGDDLHVRDAARRGLRLLPDEPMLPRMAGDFERLRPLFFTRPAPPSFPEIVEELARLQSLLDRL